MNEWYKCYLGVLSVRRTLPLLALVGDLKKHLNSHAGCFSSKLEEMMQGSQGSAFGGNLTITQIGNWDYWIRKVLMSFPAVSLASFACLYWESWLPLRLDFIIMLFFWYLWTHFFSLLTFPLLSQKSLSSPTPSLTNELLLWASFLLQPPPPSKGIKN